MNPPTLDVLYEDEWIIAINKEAGHIVHAADHPQPDDIVVMKLVRNLVGLKIYPTHRLDRPTCGVVVFAKGRTAARALNRSFERKQVEKAYLTIVVGHPTLDTWTCSEPLRKATDGPLKDATTEFQVLQTLSHLTDELTLLEARPLTGRYHQIRKHLLHCGHPIVGDYFYHGFEPCEEMGPRLGIGTRMLLQCHRLQFTHPITRKSFSSSLPPWKRKHRAAFPKIKKIFMFSPLLPLSAASKPFST